VLLNDAITAATQAGLVVLLPVPHAYNATVAQGSVISQSPAAGASAPLGTQVTLTVSDGPAPAPLPTPNIPNVVGLDIPTAERAIEQAQCNVNPVYVYLTSNIYAQGLVAAQSPAPSGSVARGTVVTLTISLGIQQTYAGIGNVTVPVMH